MSETWKNFSVKEFNFEGRNATIVFPTPGTENGRLMVKTEYRDAFPEAIELPLLRLGYHLCFIQNDSRWGSDDDLDRKARFVQYVCKEYGLSTKTVPVGMSCGGLLAILFAAKYPGLVSCLYLDAPVLNYMSCPCGFGAGIPLIDGEINGIQELLDTLHMDSVSQLLGYREMPLDKIPVLIQNQIPVVMVAGDSDIDVPYHENGLLLQRAYEQAEVPFAVYIKPECAHHPHGLQDPSKVVSFILEH